VGSGEGCMEKKERWKSVKVLFPKVGLRSNL
jgi:hypothetical protein